MHLLLARVSQTLPTTHPFLCRNRQTLFVAQSNQKHACNLVPTFSVTTTDKYAITATNLIKNQTQRSAPKSI